MKLKIVTLQYVFINKEKKKNKYKESKHGTLLIYPECACGLLLFVSPLHNCTLETFSVYKIVHSTYTGICIYKIDSHEKIMCILAYMIRSIRKRVNACSL